MANKYPTVTAAKAQQGGGKGKPFSKKKIEDFLQSDGEPGAGDGKLGGFFHHPGTDQFLWKMPNMNRAQILRLAASKIAPHIIRALREWMDEPYSDEDYSGLSSRWNTTNWQSYVDCGCAAPNSQSFWSRTSWSCCQNSSFATRQNMNREGNAGIFATYRMFHESVSTGPGGGYPVGSTGQWYYKRVGSKQPLGSAWTGTKQFRYYDPVPATGPMPKAFPQAWPQAQPQPQTKALPWSKADVGAEPSTKEKPRPTPYPLVPLPVPAVQIDNLGQGKGQLDTVPVTQTWAGTGGGSVTVRPGPIANRQPGPKKKQQKINVVAVGGRVWVLLNMATEAIDFVDAMWKAIPDDQRRKCTTPQCKLRDLWDNMGAIDLSDAVENYLNMQLTDYLSALTGIPTKKLSQQLGHITGVDRAINQVAGLWMDSGLKDLGIENHNISELFPKIDWDVNSGVVNLSIKAVGEVDIDLTDLSWSVPTSRR